MCGEAVLELLLSRSQSRRVRCSGCRTVRLVKDAAGLGAATAPFSYGALVSVAKVQEGETILIHAAAGRLGVVACQIARAVGAQVIATVGSAENADPVRKLAMDAVIRYDEPQWEKMVLKATDGKGV